jgi:hypothetical protein
MRPMKHLILVLPLLLAPSCKAMDSALGLSGGEDNSEATISATETAIKTTGDLILPGAGGALAVIFGLGARAYIRKRKAAKTA